MKQSNLAVWGMVLIVLGGLFFIGNLFEVSYFQYLWPIGLILAGFWLLLPKSKVETDTAVHGFISEVNRTGHWEVEDGAYHAFISDMSLDLTEADIPLGETKLRFSGFIGDISLRVPADVGVRVTTSAFIGENKVLGETRTGFLSPLNLQSAEYKAAERRLHIDASYFISDIKVRATAVKAVPA